MRKVTASCWRNIISQSYLLASDDLFWISGWICIADDSHHLALAPLGEQRRAPGLGGLGEDRLNCALYGRCAILNSGNEVQA